MRPIKFNIPYALLLSCGLIILFSSFKGENNDTTSYYVSSSTLNLRAEPSTNSEIVVKLKQYDNLSAVSPALDGWLKVAFQSHSGYVSTKYVKPGKAVVSSYEIRTGAECRDGTSSTATGRGACSHHGGVAYWKTKTRTSVQIVQ